MYEQCENSGVFDLLMSVDFQTVNNSFYCCAVCKQHKTDDFKQKH
jgi:hypothetical protein